MSSEFYCECETLEQFSCPCSQQCTQCKQLEGYARAAADPCEFMVNVESDARG